MSTNGQSATPNRDRIAMEAAYFAAVAGYYDTSEAAQKAELLTVTVVNMVGIPGEPLPQGATHRFYVMINDTGYMVTRSAFGVYAVDSHDHLDRQRHERELRDAVLDAALWQLGGQPSKYFEGEARIALIKQFLEDGDDARRPADPVAHPVIRDEPPSLTLGDGEDAVPAQRQWIVEIGPRHRCIVAFFGYDAGDGIPSLVTRDVDGDEAGQ